MNSIIAFNFYYNIYFWFFFILIVVIFRFLSLNQSLQKIVLLSSNILMLLALPRFNFFSLLFICTMSIFTFFIGHIINNNILIKLKAIRIFITSSTILLLILILSFFKYSRLQEIFYRNFTHEEHSASGFIFIIGISYFSFKMMHFIIESYKQQITNMSVINFLNYLFYFPAFISGPINRFNHFSSQIDREKTSQLKNDLRIGSQRVVHGLFKKFVLCPIVFPYAIVNIQKSITEMKTNEVIISLYAYTLYFYFDFSAYSDLAIGSAKILGVELPENFNKPFLKKNLQQLWANWHISLTSWLTDYIYWPLSKKLRTWDYFKKHPILLSNICIIVTFLICGMWHGDSANFIIWGLYHGLGLVILNVYQKQKRKIKNTFIRKYYLSQLSQILGIFITFNYFAFGILFFTLDWAQLKLLLTRIC